MQRAQQSQQKHYNQHHSKQEFAVGDYVLLSTKNIQVEGSRKLNPRFIGPFQVLARRGTQTYLLDLPPHLRHLHPSFHTSLLRPAPPPIVAVDDAPLPPRPLGPSPSSSASPSPAENPAPSSSAPSPNSSLPNEEKRILRSSKRVFEEKKKK